MATAAFTRAQPRSETSVRAENLLNRYPDLSKPEIDELTILYPRLNLVDRGLIAADARLGRRVEYFYRDHGNRLGGWSAQTASLASAVMVAGLMFWIALA